MIRNGCNLNQSPALKAMQKKKKNPTKNTIEFDFVAPFFVFKHVSVRYVYKFLMQNEVLLENLCL